MLVSKNKAFSSHTIQRSFSMSTWTARTCSVFLYVVWLCAGSRGTSIDLPFCQLALPAEPGRLPRLLRLELLRLELDGTAAMWLLCGAKLDACLLNGASTTDLQRVRPPTQSVNPSRLENNTVVHTMNDCRAV